MPARTASTSRRRSSSTGSSRPPSAAAEARGRRTTSPACVRIGPPLRAARTPRACRRQRHLRPRCPHRLAHPSSGPNPDRHRRLRLGPALGGPIEEIRPGDVVWFPAGREALARRAPTTAMTHIAIQEQSAMAGRRVAGTSHRRTLQRVIHPTSTHKGEEEHAEAQTRKRRASRSRPWARLHGLRRADRPAGHDRADPRGGRTRRHPLRHGRVLRSLPQRGARRRGAGALPGPGGDRHQVRLGHRPRDRRPSRRRQQPPRSRSAAPSRARCAGSGSTASTCSTSTGSTPTCRWRTSRARSAS